jgi:hypothetical protein
MSLVRTCAPTQVIMIFAICGIMIWTDQAKKAGYRSYSNSNFQVEQHTKVSGLQ